MGSIKGTTTADNDNAWKLQLYFDYEFGGINWGNSQNTTTRDFTFSLRYNIQFHWDYGAEWKLNISTNYQTLYSETFSNRIVGENKDI